MVPRAAPRSVLADLSVVPLNQCSRMAGLYHSGNAALSLDRSRGWIAVPHGKLVAPFVAQEGSVGEAGPYPLVESD